MSEKQENNKQFAIQKLYVKDASFESPASPGSFSFSKWDPKIDLNLSNTQKHVDGDIYEAVLCVTVTVNHNETTVFLVEVHQAALVTLSGFDEDEKKYLLGSQCMTILFPYAREVISDLSTRGGFPPVILSPVNFDALYHQHIQQKQADKEEAEVAH
ncbi:MAG: protein-export chaperone SecB [Gammaproteobacteria bacterium]|nr:MAG: protein-export chaperone SecB [Gammaproteobacteria bacterium]